MICHSKLPVIVYFNALLLVFVKVDRCPMNNLLGNTPSMTADGIKSARIVHIFHSREKN